MKNPGEIYLEIRFITRSGLVNVGLRESFFQNHQYEIPPSFLDSLYGKGNWKPRGRPTNVRGGGISINMGTTIAQIKKEGILELNQTNMEGDQLHFFLEVTRLFYGGTLNIIEACNEFLKELSALAEGKHTQLPLVVVENKADQNRLFFCYGQKKEDRYFFHWQSPQGSSDNLRLVCPSQFIIHQNSSKTGVPQNKLSIFFKKLVSSLKNGIITFDVEGKSPKER